MKIDYCAKTDIGKVRKENQDTYGVLETKNLFFVCDGMGGAASGDFASNAAAKIILKAYEILTSRDINTILNNPNINPDVVKLLASIRLANRALHNFAEKYHKLSGMGTTFASVLFDMHNQSIMHICHVGDSRVYRLRKGVFQQLTKDHSKINELIGQGKITEEEASTSEIKSMITRALGTQSTVEIDYRVENVLPGDYFMLCTDGLCGEVDDEAIKKVIVESSSNELQSCEQLINLANNVSGRDNTTVIALKVEDGIASPVENEITDVGVITINKETQKEMFAEDRVLEVILRKAKIKIPKEAKEKAILRNPLYLGVFIVAMTFAISFLSSKISLKKPETELIDLTGKVIGIRPEVRVPVKEQIQKFISEKDRVSRIQIIQDWYKYKDENTEPLEGAELLLMKNGEERFRCLTSTSSPEIKLADRGEYNLHLSYRSYKVVTTTGQQLSTVDVSIEPSDSLKPILLIMVPE